MSKLVRMVWNNHFSLPDLPPPGSFQNQTILITGASGGLGLAAAAHFVNLGASSVIITARSNAKGEAAKAAIEAQTKTEGKGIVKFMILDMSTFKDTKLFADKVKAELQTIDYVLLNAGMLNIDFALGKEGHEETMEINLLATTLLALLLLPWMRKAGRGKAHLGFVTSGLHRGVPIDSETFPKQNVLEFFDQKVNFPKQRGIYAISKLFLEYVMLEISRLAVGADGKPEVIVNGMCPGRVYSDLGRQYRSGVIMSYAVNSLMAVISKPTEGGARTLVLAAMTTPEENGKYITHYQTDEDYKIAAQKTVFGPEGRKMQATVWREVLSVLKEKMPEVGDLSS